MVGSKQWTFIQREVENWLQQCRKFVRFAPRLQFKFFFLRIFQFSGTPIASEIASQTALSTGVHSYIFVLFANGMRGMPRKALGCLIDGKEDRLGYAVRTTAVSLNRVLLDLWITIVQKR